MSGARWSRGVVAGGRRGSRGRDDLRRVRRRRFRVRDATARADSACRRRSRSHRRSPRCSPPSVVGAREYLRVGLLDRRVAKLAVLAGLPAVIAGAALSGFVGGTALVVLSGLMLFAVGVRIAWPTRDSRLAAPPVLRDAKRRSRRSSSGSSRGRDSSPGCSRTAAGCCSCRSSCWCSGSLRRRRRARRWWPSPRSPIPTLIAHVGARARRLGGRGCLRRRRDPRVDRGRAARAPAARGASLGARSASCW